MIKKLIVPIIAVLTLVLGVAGLMAYRSAQNAAGYADIQAAVSAQRFADDLHNSQQTTYDCNSKTDSECQAIRYYVTADKCEDVVEGIIKSDKQNSECQATRTNFSHDGANFGAQLAQLDVGYELTVWNSN